MSITAEYGGWHQRMRNDAVLRSLVDKPTHLPMKKKETNSRNLKSLRLRNVLSPCSSLEATLKARRSRIVSTASARSFGEHDRYVSTCWKHVDST